MKANILDRNQFLIEPLDPEKESHLFGLYCVTAALDKLNFGVCDDYNAAERYAALTNPSPDFLPRKWLCSAIISGKREYLGVLEIIQRMNPKPELYIVLQTHPQYRHQGVASALIEKILLPEITRFSKSTRGAISVFAFLPTSRDSSQNLPIDRIASRLGVVAKCTNNISVCHLPLADSLINQIQDKISAVKNPYRIEIWDDEIPPQYLAEFCRLDSMVNLEAPTEDAEFANVTTTTEYIEEFAKRRAARNAAHLYAAAISPDNQLAGISYIYYSRYQNRRLLNQENTYVALDHRGNNLGLALKLASHKAIMKFCPQAQLILTFNNHCNEAMLRINKELGYHISLQEIVFQKA